MDSVRPWMALSWLWAAWRIERSSHSISFSFSCSFYRQRQVSLLGCQTCPTVMRFFWCSIPYCWPRSRGSWPAGIGPGAGPSAARWHTDRPHTHTGSVDSAAPQQGSVMTKIQQLNDLWGGDFVCFKFMKNTEAAGCITFTVDCGICVQHFKTLLIHVCTLLKWSGVSVHMHELARVCVLKVLWATIIFT